MITHKKMSLFDAPQGSVIVHACNSQGVWGSGIAKPFKEKYPKSFDDYYRFCTAFNRDKGTACGRAGISLLTNETHKVGWIVTSHNYGDKKDTPEVIKINTALALDDLCKALYRSSSPEEKVTVYSNKFNSGLFAVPWHDSEFILNLILSRYPRINWVVCDPEL